ncbi:MAG: YCF48-related protein [Candidatus Kapaibacteriota bacterium]
MFRHLLLIGIALCCRAALLFSQPTQNLNLTPWQAQSPLPQTNPDSLFPYRGVVLRAIFFSSEASGCAVGERGNIITTQDGGTTWQAARSNAVVDFSDVFFINPRRGWAVSTSGRGGVYATQDSGRTWTLQSAQVFASSVSFSDSLNGAAAGENGTVYRTVNGGQTWTEQRIPSPNTVNDVQFVSPQSGFVAARDGIFSTSDGGTTWTKSAVPVGEDIGFTNIHFVNPQIGWATGENNTLLATTNGGQTWQQQVVPTPNTNDDLDAVRFVTPNIGWVSSGNARLYRTTDGGRSWTLSNDFPIPQNGFLSNFHFFDAQNGWAITTRIFPGSRTINGEHYVIWRTRDGGISWQQVSTSRISILTDLAITGKETVLAVGTYLMNRTTNGGNLWTINALVPDTASRVSQFYQAVSALNERIAFAAGWYGRTSRTDDGGATWKPLTLSEVGGNDSLLGVHFVDSLTGWTVGIRHGYDRTPSINRIYRTSNGGRSWTRQTPLLGFADAPNSALNDVVFINATVGWVVGNDGVIYKTLNAGATWTRQASGTRSNLLRAFFLNENLGYVCGGNADVGIILQTSDGGTTWRRQLVPADGALRGIFFADAQQGWAVGNNGVILATRNGGSSWEVQQSGTQSHLYGIGFANPVRGWVVGDNGVILATQNGGFTPRALVASSMLDFGRVAVSDNTTRTLNISAENLLAPLTVTAPAGFTVEFAGQRGQRISFSPTALAATQATVTLRFTPTRDGVVNAVLRIESPFISSTVALVGIGVQRPVLRFSPEQERLTFAPTLVRSETRATLTVTNIGVTSGVVSLVLVPADTTRNAIFGGLPETLAPIQIAPNRSETLQLRFAPRTFGLAQATLEVRITSPSFDTTYRVMLQGTGLQAALQAQPTTLDLGSVSLTQSTVASIGFANIGNFPANLRRVVIDPPDHFSLASPFAAVAFAPQDILSLAVRFSPKTLGFVRSSLLLISDTDTLRANLIGTGIPLLDAPSLVSPYNERINTPTLTIFQWRQPSMGVAFDVQISRDSTFATVDVQQSLLRSLSFTPTAELLNSTRYYWRVRARTPSASSDWSAVYQFQTLRANPLLRSSQELILTSGVVGQTQRGYISVRSSVRDTILKADFLLLNDNAAYSIRQDQFPLVLRANAPENITFDFSPKLVSSGLRGILRLTARRDTLLVPFLGESFAADSSMIFTRVVVQTDRQSASAGDSVNIWIVMAASQNLDAGRNQGKAQSFNALLRIRNESLLAPSGTLAFPADLSNNIFVGNGGKTIELRNIPRTSGMKTGTLAELPAKILLGDATTTAVEFLMFEWSDTQEQRTIQAVVDSSVATIVCNSGGAPRLIQRRQAAQLQALAPNPASETITAQYALLETGTTAMYLMDVLGNRVRTYFEGNRDWGTYSETLDVSGLADGVYLLVLQTPSQVLQRRISVIK